MIKEKKTFREKFVFLDILSLMIDGAIHLGVELEIFVYDIEWVLQKKYKSFSWGHLATTAYIPSVFPLFVQLWLLSMTVMSL